MALGLFNRMETRKGLLAVEKISLYYNLLTTLLILLLYGRMDHPGQMLAERGMIAFGTFLLVWLYRFAPCKAAIFLRIAFQMALLSYWYPDTYEFNRLFPNLDHWFASADQWLFGGQPAIWFSQRFPEMYVSEPLNMGYFFYYPMIALVALWYFFAKYQQFSKITFILVSSFFIYYLIYIFLPVAGPQFYFPAIGAESVHQGIFPAIGDYFNHHSELHPGPGFDHGFFYSLVEESQQVGERPTAAFPSSHIGISTILMILSWKGTKKLFFLLVPFYLLLCGATVYIQAHYLVDAIGGFVSAFMVYAASVWLYRFFREPSV